MHSPHSSPGGSIVRYGSLPVGFDPVKARSSLVAVRLIVVLAVALLLSFGTVGQPYFSVKGIVDTARFAPYLSHTAHLLTQSGTEQPLEIRAVSKQNLSVAIPTAKTAWQVNTFANSSDGIRSLPKLLPVDVHCVLEATGSYSVLATYMLCQTGVVVSLINPKQTVPLRQTIKNGTQPSENCLYGL